MKVKELIEKLKEFPEDMTVWVSDNGNSEGGTRLISVEKVLAIDAGLDGDDVDDEYFFIDEDFDESILKNPSSYIKHENFVSKEIVYLNDSQY